ncbi:MAG: YHS domain-containing protein [Candidatus Korarchaeota archaeon]|nr:YHS domain-containing protein [Candidatus Korarchaeota archaeon]NIU83422.1 YHS domain-containing protein [Candidatus Thorarchaeota archaeon]NIW13694.1 YHS domain-containing protein [Candidatus Thorarchaeota archaeon]NIW51793.1 YHS domain-containing protein [Candidatus Korarchaeota archaeon]
MPEDPVCGMEVTKEDAEYKTLYQGTVYYFCSKKCKKKFEEKADYYLEHGPEGM